METRFSSGRATRAVLLLLLSAVFPFSHAFVAFESGQVRPLAQSPDGSRVFVTNTPDGTLDIFEVTGYGLRPAGSVAVGLEPVAVAARSDTEVWVVNHLSDSISIVDVSGAGGQVVRTLHVGDEPRDIVFAGPGANRAFITTAHRGQNSPYVNPANPGELTSEGIGRSDVWVFNANALGASLGGTPETVLTLFGDTPRPLAVSPDGSEVYAAVFHSGNQTTTVNEGVVCDGGAGASACVVDGLGSAPGGLPAPNTDMAGNPQPEVGLIVKHNGSHWVDEQGRSWDDVVRFTLPDLDVFTIDATSNPPQQTQAFAHVGTILFNIAVHPVSGKLYVSNTEAFNHVRFEGTRPATPDPLLGTVTSVVGHLHETRITVIDPATSAVMPRHVNKHIDYAQVPAPAAMKEKSLALPRGIAMNADGSTLYLAAKGSRKIGVFNTAEIEADTFVPDSADHITLAAGGPEGLLYDTTHDRLYVTTRFDNGISVIDAGSGTEIQHLAMHNPEPPAMLAGRQFLYDATLTSSNGEAACGSCHVDGDFDGLAWDLGDPFVLPAANPNPGPNGLPFSSPPFHGLKGPMATQTLRGMSTHGPMHWRGDRSNGDSPPNSKPDSGSYNEFEAFKKFNVAFEGLNGASAALNDADMSAFSNFILNVQLPPNPIGPLDYDSPTAAQAAGRNLYFTHPSDAGLPCNFCHVLDRAQGAFGTDGGSTFEGLPQNMKVPHLRNLYTKVGMFGMADVPFNVPGNNGHKGDQVRGFGFLHDGSTDSLLRFFHASLFNLTPTQRSQMEQFMFAFDTDLFPVVGQQVSISNSSDAALIGRLDLMKDEHDNGRNDLVVQLRLNGEYRSGTRLPTGSWQLDRQAQSPLTEAQLLSAASASAPVTVTAVAPGSGDWFGLDRDADGLWNGDDNCAANADPDQTDTDADGNGDVCDNDDDNDQLDDVTEADLGTDTLLADSDMDGLSDFDEVNQDGNPQTYTVGVDTDPNNADTDGDGLNDGQDPDPLNAAVATQVVPLGVWPSLLLAGLLLAFGMRRHLTLAGWRRS